MSDIIECPSGLSGRIKYLAAEAAGVLGNARELRTGHAADRILNSCWVETTNAGPYILDSQGKLNWDRVLSCDKTYLLVMIRVETFGESYELDLRCPGCTNKFVWDVPLSQLPMRLLPAASRNAIAMGTNKFETALRDGRKVWFRLMDGLDQLRALKVIRENSTDLVTASLQTRVLEVENVKARDLPKFLAELSMGDVESLISSFDEIDGGIETSIEVFCQGCQYEWEIELPLDLQAMFAPSKLRRKRQRAKQAQGQTQT